MGGQFDYFGFFVGADFETGHSKAHPLSTTYNSPMLSSEMDFELAMLEVLPSTLGIQAEQKQLTLDSH